MKGDYFYKDLILKIIKPSPGLPIKEFTTQDLATSTSLDLHVINYLLEDLNRDNLVYLTDLPNPEKEKYAAQITDNGIVFYDFGGYKKIIRKEKWQLRWKIVKTLAIGVYAIVIPAVVIWAIWLQFREEEELPVKQKLEVNDMLNLEKKIREVREDLTEQQKKDSLQVVTDSIANKY